MLYVHILVILCFGVVVGTILAPELGKMVTVLARALVQWGTRPLQRRQARAEAAMERAGRQVRSVRR
jgi:hypothetical protein